MQGRVGGQELFLDPRVVADLERVDQGARLTIDDQFEVIHSQTGDERAFSVGDAHVDAHDVDGRLELDRHTILAAVRRHGDRQGQRHPDGHTGRLSSFRLHGWRLVRICDAMITSPVVK